MRLGIGRVLAAVGCVVGLASTAGAEMFGVSQVLSSYSPTRSDLEASGPEVVFPLKADFPFPWSSIEGIWQAKAKGFEAYFSFEVQTTCDGRNVLRVFHIDPQLGGVIAQGTGIGDEDRRIVTAIMSNNISGESYMLFIGAFKNKVSAAPKTVTVLTVRPVEDSELAKDVQIIVNKVGTEPYRLRGVPTPNTSREGTCPSEYFP